MIFPLLVLINILLKSLAESSVVSRSLYMCASLSSPRLCHVISRYLDLLELWILFHYWMEITELCFHILSLRCGLEAFTMKWTRAFTGFSSFIYFLSVFSILCYLLFNIWNAFSWNFAQLLRQMDKSGYCFTSWLGEEVQKPDS